MTLADRDLSSASLTTWTTQLNTLEHYAAERERFGADLITVVADPLERLRIRHEDIRKRHTLYADNLKRQQEMAVQELQKLKTSYDVTCQSVENRRKKLDSSVESSKQKSQGAFQQQLMEMHNVKARGGRYRMQSNKANKIQNTYLIGINVANQQKHKYHQEYLPDLLNVSCRGMCLGTGLTTLQRLQDLNEIRIMKLNRLWSLAVQLERSSLARSVETLDHALSEIPRNDPSLDSIMFMRHNLGHVDEPHDVAFEPSPVWHDDAQMVVDEQAKNYLRNMLAKSKTQLLEQNKALIRKRDELDKIQQIHASVRAGTDKRDEVEVVAAVLAVQESYQSTDKDRLAAEVEVATIKAVAGDLTLGVRNHKLRPETFRMPTNCDLCGERIWGLTAKGYDCSDCGYTCHNKCEMKVPASCPGELSKEEKRKLKAEREKASHAAPSGDPPPTAELPAISRSNTMNSLSSGYATSARRSVSTTAAASSTAPSVASSERTLAEETPNGGSGGSGGGGGGGGGAAPTPAPKSQSSSARRNRIVAPPPTKYVSELPGNEVAPSKVASASASEPTGRMMYAYQRNGADELTVDEGVSVSILEPDGIFSPFLPLPTSIGR